MGRRVPIPLTFLVVLLLGLAALGAQGLRMAHDRFERLLPSRSVLWLLAAPQTEAVFDMAERPRFLVADLDQQVQAGDRVGLYQTYPQRTLVRWIEPAAARAPRYLVVPLEGLGPGDYLLTRVALAEAAGPREMDLPIEELAVIGRFRLILR